MVNEQNEETGYREVCDYTFREHVVILGKRLLAMPSKMIGFKPGCLYLATWLLVTGRIGEWVWFAVLVCVLFGIVGLKVMAQMRAPQGGEG
jgi:hypothetical protein